MKQKLLSTTASIQKTVLLLVLLLPPLLYAQAPPSQPSFQNSDKEAISLTTARNFTHNTDYTTINRGGNIDNGDDLKFSVFPKTTKEPQKGVFNIFPNPAVSETSVVFNAYENGLDYNLNMISSDGKPMLAKKGTTVYGTNMVRLDISSYPTGVYYIQLITKNGRQAMKLVKNVK